MPRVKLSYMGFSGLCISDSVLGSYMQMAGGGKHRPGTRKPEFRS